LIQILSKSGKPRFRGPGLCRFDTECRVRPPPKHGKSTEFGAGAAPLNPLLTMFGKVRAVFDEKRSFTLSSGVFPAAALSIP
jgi:hypothetical protein